MEWKGINLTDYRAKQWKQNIYKKGIYLFLIAIVAVTLAIYLQLTVLQINQQNRPLVNQVAYLKKELVHLNGKLARSRSSPPINIGRIFTEEHIAKYLTLLQDLPLPQGGIEEVIFEYNEMPTMKIVGIFSHSDQFERLEKYLSEQKVFGFELVNFQINDQHQLEFSFNITLRE
ncbi:hypothetical protein [Actinobacillus arthritidis]|uniref:hypothetical protein n=1 Tax=Actinobacillus arthritidis TaxID=157339 RepID=UPI0024421E85|nr:hypothetical protein [Actinobacillus arthritidis]WGE89620.1 hypothetical protein NYR89_01345 [Actinobacillus arthritidis]